MTALVQRLNRDRFYELALETVEAAARNDPPSELAVELELQAASSEAALGRSAEAARRLDRMLSRLAPDYARRAEVVSRRVALLTSDAERAEVLKSARAAWAAAPSSEVAALDLAGLLAACELRREALQVLLEAAGRLPLSLPLETAALEMLERLGDEAGIRDFLRDRLNAQPNRIDLAGRLAVAQYASGEPAEAARSFDRLLESLPESDRATRRLELARALRRMALPAVAAAQLEQVLAADPARLDVRRELAEMRLAANDPEGARRLLREALAADATIENFLDLIQFMLAPGATATWPEARDALRDRLSREPGNFEVTLLLVDVLGRLGDQAEGESILLQARALADTEARYRRWIESGLALAGEGDATERFFEAEQARLVADAEAATGGWSAELVARYLFLCESVSRADIDPRLISAVRARLDDAATPAGLRVPLRRLLVEALRRDPTQVVEVENQLQALAVEDAGRANEYRLRLARAGHEAAQRDGGRPDRVRALLRSIEVTGISDPALLRGAHSLFIDYGDPASALAVLERLTQLEPGDAGHWERWISVLAAQGEEDRLRDALRRLLSGVTSDPLAAETLELVRGHFVDSCWRSVARVLTEGGKAEQSEMPPLLDAIERMRPDGPERLWVAWARGLSLQRAGRSEAAAEAAEQFSSLARRWFDHSSDLPQLSFPDGLVVSLDQALTLLREPPAPPAVTVGSPEGPDRPPTMHWGFATDDAAPIVQVEPMERDGGLAIAVLDQAGTLYHLDAATGKLRWRRTGLWTGASSAPTPPARGRQARLAAGFFGADGNNPVVVAPRCAVDEARGRLVLSHRGVLTVLAAADGQVVWQAELARASRRVPPQAGVAPLPPLADEVFVDDAGRVIVWRAETAVVAAFQPDSGKLLWSRDVALESPPPTLGPLNSGASCDGTRILVYGHRPCVLDTATGTVVWSFAGESVREFPVVLKSSASTGLVGSPPLAAVALPGRAGFLPGGLNAPRRVPLNHLKPLAGRGGVLGQWMQGRGALVAPAVSWAEQNGQPLGGELTGGRLFLSLPGLTLSPTLALPLGGPRLEASAGTWLGAAGPRAVYVGDAGLTIFDGLRGGSVVVPLGQVGGVEGDRWPAGAGAGSDGDASDARLPLLPVEGTMAGTRVFVTGPGGVLAVNPLNGRVLFASAWPEAVRQFAGPDGSRRDGEGAAPDLARSQQFTPRYLLQSSATATTALRPRSAARGRWLFAVLGADRLAALAAD